MKGKFAFSYDYEFIYFLTCLFKGRGKGDSNL